MTAVRDKWSDRGLAVVIMAMLLLMVTSSAWTQDDESRNADAIQIPEGQNELRIDSVDRVPRQLLTANRQRVLCIRAEPRALFYPDHQVGAQGSLDRARAMCETGCLQPCLGVRGRMVERASHPPARGADSSSRFRRDVMARCA